MINDTRQAGLFYKDRRADRMFKGTCSVLGVHTKQPDSIPLSSMRPIMQLMIQHCAWLEENCEGGFTTSGYSFQFELESDAIKFYFVWGKNS